MDAQMAENLSAGFRGGRSKLPPEVNRILYVRNLPYKITAEDMYDIFGKFGSIRQIRKGVEQHTKGTAFVIFDDIYDAKNAMDNLSGFNVAGRYLVLLYYNADKMRARNDAFKQREELEQLKKKHNIE